tara:strand:+ start:909 stop:1853 length:945 start_codon:yes stop_codon:yes gene_type:complete
VSGWLLIIFLLLLGGLISTLGDLLGTKIGKARFSILKLRPKRTATLITIITGGLISASSLSLMILVNRQLRLGLFRLGDIQRKLQESRQELIPLKQERQELENELQILERDLYALRSGQVVLRSGQSLIIHEINADKEDLDLVIQDVIQNANLITQNIVQPNADEKIDLLRFRKDHIEELKKLLKQGGDWVINIKSVGNVLKGENYVYAFPEVTENKVIVSKGETISQIKIYADDFSNKEINNKISLLLGETLAEAKSRGSLVDEIIVNDSLRELQEFLNKNQNEDIYLEAVSLRRSKTAQPVVVEITFTNIAP